MSQPWSEILFFVLIRAVGLQGLMRLRKPLSVGKSWPQAPSLRLGKGLVERSQGVMVFRVAQKEIA